MWLVTLMMSIIFHIKLLLIIHNFESSESFCKLQMAPPANMKSSKTQLHKQDNQENFETDFYDH